MIIISKEELAKEGIFNLDTPDAFAQTFVTPEIVPLDSEEEEMLILREERMGKVDPFNPFG